MVWWMLATSSSPSAWMPPVPSCTRSDVGSAVSSMVVAPGSSAITSVASQAVTWMRRSCPAFAAAPASLRPHGEGGIVGPKPVSARLERHAPSI